MLVRISWEARLDALKGVQTGADSTNLGGVVLSPSAGEATLRQSLPEGAQAYSPGGDAPDGSPFAYVEEDHGSLVVVRSDGSGSVTLLTPERGTTLGAIGFSPKGDRVLFWRLKNGEFSLWSIGVDGSDARLVVAGTDQGAWLVLR